MCPPIADVDPLVRHQVLVKVPTRVKIERGTDTLAIEVDRNSLQTTNITVGSKMVTGVQSELFVYAEGDARPSQPGRIGLSGGLDFNLGKDFFNSKQQGIPMPGKKYVVEMDLSIFETDIPPQHMWSPYGKNYRVLWKRTLRRLVE